MPDIHPELTGVRFMPPIPYGRRTIGLLRARPKTPRAPDDVRIEDVRVPGPLGTDAVRVRLYRPTTLAPNAPALFWVHGGGFVIGTPEQDERMSIRFARELGITVAAVQYRLAPENPAPAGLDDAFAGLTWLFENAGSLGVDPARVAIGGASAGGGIAAGLVLMAHDRGLRPVFQLLVYPMLDDRTVTRTEQDAHKVYVWSRKANRFGWSSYLGQEPGGAEVSPYAAPSRRENLHGLPPAWMGVGSLDLFHDEDLTYAERLREAGVACEVLVVPGAFHGFDQLYGTTRVVEEFRLAQLSALRTALFDLGVQSRAR